MKKRVLQLINSFHQGGSERQAVQLTRLLREDGTFDVFLACLNDEGVLRSEVESLGFTEIPEFKLSSFFNLDFVRQVRKCATFIKENRIDVVHTHDFYTNIFGMFAAKLAGVKAKIASKRETGGMRSNSQKIIEKLAFRMANGIVVNADAVKKYLIDEGIAPQKLATIYNGLDLKRLHPNSTDRSSICKQIGLPNDGSGRFITLVANLRHEVKNQPMFLKAAGIVVKKFPDAHFVLAGEGELKAGLQNIADDLNISGNVHFIGRCTKIPELLFVSEIGVLSSFNEGFSNSILEYMAAGKPVVATRVGGAAEAIIEGETGYLVTSDDHSAMADLLIQLLENQGTAVNMGSKGRRSIEEKFSCEAQLSNTLNLYDRLLKK